MVYGFSDDDNDDGVNDYDYVYGEWTRQHVAIVEELFEFWQDYCLFWLRFLWHLSRRLIISIPRNMGR
jgi:hypothetical protein